MARSTLPKTMSNRELARRAAELSIRASSAVVLFNGSLEDDDFVRVSVHATEYFLPPCAYGTHPRTGERRLWDGTLTLKDKMGVVTNMDEKDSIAKNARNPRAVRDQVIAPAYAIAAKILEFRQSRGVIALNGDDSDAELKHQASSRWVEWRREAAKKTVLNYHRQQAAVRNGNTPGLTVEPMDDHQNSAQEFIDRWNSGAFDKYKGEIQGNPLRCLEKDCGYSAKAGKEEAFTLHLQSTHKMTPEQIQAKYLDEPVEDEKPARGKGRK